MTSSVQDERSGKSWPCHNYQNHGTTISVDMAGQEGYKQVTQGAAGYGSVIDGHQQTRVRLPGQKGGGTYQVTFTKA